MENGKNIKNHLNARMFIMGILTAISITMAIVFGVLNIRESKGIENMRGKVEDHATRLLGLENSYQVLGNKIDRLIEVVEKHTGTR